MVKMVIDIHVHTFPDKIAAKAIESLEIIYGVKALSDGTVDGLIAHMAESGVDLSVIQSVSTVAQQVVSINTWIADLLLKDCPVIGFGTIHPEFEGYRDEIQRMKELGIKGVKFQPSFQRFYPDEERMFPIYEELIKAGLAILFHAGDEIQPASVVYATPERLARVLDAMQSDMDSYNYRVQMGDICTGPARIIAAHLGGYMMWDQVEEHLLGRDLYLDVSYVFGHLDFARANRMITSHGTDKVLFASDFPFADQKKDIQAVLQLGITQVEKEKILGGNVSRLLDLGARILRSNDSSQS